ncbi:MAG: glycosyltransferase [Mucilaginibacter sp.]
MKSKRKTLVILTPGFPKDKSDTTCLPPLQTFVKALKSICPGLNIIVISFQYPFYTAEYNWHGINIISVGGKGKGRLLRLITWLKVWRRLQKLRGEQELFGVLSFWLGECAFVGSRFARKYRLTHYTWILGQDAKKNNKYFRWIKPKGEELIAMSDFLVREMHRNYGVKPLHVIPVGVDISMFGNASLKRDIDIMSAGSLIPLKRYRFFVEAIISLKSIFPGIRAVICGDGPEMLMLKSLAEKSGVTDNITFKGEVPHKQVIELMQRAKVFLHPSEYEGFGTVLSEALYSGAQLVSFTKPMDKEYSHHFVVKTQDEMNARLVSLLKTKKINHDPVLICTIEQIAKNMICLFAD